MATTTVTGTWLKPNGDPASGRVTFRLVAATYHDGLDAIFPQTPVTAALDATGSISIELEPTSGVDADFDATDMTYEVVERITGAQRDPYYVDIPTAAGVDLGTLVTYEEPQHVTRVLVDVDAAALGIPQLIADHAAAADPHTGYLTEVAANATYERVGTSRLVSPPTHRKRLDFSGTVAHQTYGPTYESSPTPYTGTELVHPDVLYVARGFAGYAYWMAVTPYPASAVAHENPSVYCSHDGRTWVTPDGLTNPVIPANVDGSYNSDPDLVDGQDGYLYLFYRRVYGSDRDVIMVTRSVDGVTWSTPTATLDPGSLSYATTRPASPAVVFDGLTWRMFYVDIVDRSLQVRTADTYLGPWSDAVEIESITEPSGKTWWHMDAVMVGTQIVLLLNVVNAGGTALGRLYLAWSDDAGATFTIGDDPFMTNDPDALYRSTMVIVDQEEPTIQLWYGVIGTGNAWKIGYTETTVKSYADTITDDLLPVLLGLAPGCADTFNRADNAAAVGTSTSGHLWSTATGTAGVSSRQLYLPSASNTRAVVDGGLADGRFICTLAVDGTQTWLLFRYSDESNWWRFGSNGSNLMAVEKYAAGVLTGMTSTAGFGSIIPASGDIVEVRAAGSVMTFWRNGKQIGALTDSHNASATKIGVQSADTTSRWDNIAAISA